MRKPPVSDHRSVRPLVFLPFLFAIALQAQTVATELSGVVYEAGNLPLAGVGVEVISGNRSLAETTGTDGKFRFCCLAGQVEIIFRHQDSSVAGKFALTLSPAKPSHVIAELRTGSDEGWRLNQDLSQADTSTRIYSEAELTGLPSTLSLWSFVAHTEVSATAERFDIAGMHGDEIMRFGSRGGSWSQNAVLWNGFNVTSGDGSRTLLLPDLTSVASITHSAGSAAIFPPGASLLLQPVSGEPAVHGQARLFVQSGALQNTNVTPRLRSFGITESDERYRHFVLGSAGLGGPLSSNWTYFGATSVQRSEKWIRNHLLPVAATLASGSVHLSGHLSARDRAGVVWLGQQARQPRGGANPQTAAEATLDTTRTFRSLQVSWTRTVSARTLFDTRAAFSAGETDAALQPGADQPSREELFPGSVDIALVPSALGGRSIVAMLNRVRTGAAPRASRSLDRRVQAAVQVHALRGGAGTSIVRLAIGADFERLRTYQRTHAFENINLRYFRGAPDSVQLLNPGSAHNGSVRARGYAAGNFNIGALTLSLSGEAAGARGSNRKSAAPENRLRWMNFGAHLGVNYQIGRRYPAVLRAALAHRYQDAIIRALDAIHPDGPAVSTYLWNDLNRDAGVQPVELGRLTRVEGSPFTRPDPRLQQPYAREIHLEAAKELPGRLVLSLYLFRRVYHRMQGLINTGVPSSAYRAVEVFDPGNDGAGRTGDETSRVAYNQEIDTLGQDSYLLTNPDDANAFAEGYEARAAMTGERLRWELAFTQYRAVARTPPGNGPLQNDWAVFAVSNDPNQSANAYGSTFFDRGQAARLWGIWEPGWNLRLGWLCSYLDGAPYGRILPVSGLNQGLIGILATRRGPGDGSANEGKRTAYNLTADIRISRGFNLKRGRIDATLDVFNLLNSAHALREADVTSPVHLWRIPLSFQTPRSLQPGLRFTW